MPETSLSYAAFSSDHLLASGPLGDVLSAVKNSPEPTACLIFENTSGRQVDFDLRGSLAEVLARTQGSTKPAGRGRPKLGVESREITLLPRHWDWLQAQPRGASATLRQLVEQASRHTDPAADRRQRRDAAYRFMSAMAGNQSGFEEASRALYAGDEEAFGQLMEDWPADIRAHILQLLRSETGAARN